MPCGELVRTPARRALSVDSGPAGPGEPQRQMAADAASVTKGQLAHALGLRALVSLLPIAWVSADSLYGQERRFRRVPDGRVGNGGQPRCAGPRPTPRTARTT